MLVTDGGGVLGGGMGMGRRRGTLTPAVRSRGEAPKHRLPLLMIVCPKVLFDYDSWYLILLAFHSLINY